MDAGRHRCRVSTTPPECIMTILAIKMIVITPVIIMIKNDIARTIIYVGRWQRGEEEEERVQGIRSQVKREGLV